MTERYLVDFEVGQNFGGSGQIRVDTERIKRFAAEFDPQPFHFDEKAAADSCAASAEMSVNRHGCLKCRNSTRRFNLLTGTRERA
jgi:acyl dehydratase